MNHLVAYHTLLQIFKIRKSQQPEYLFGILGRDNRNGHIVVTNTQLSLAKKSFTFKGSELWNHIPADIRYILRLGNYKEACRNWIKAQIPRFPNNKKRSDVCQGLGWLDTQIQIFILPLIIYVL